MRLHLYFNSIKVQLERSITHIDHTNIKYFNSIKVQLEQRIINIKQR